MSFSGGPETRLDGVLNFVIDNKHTELRGNHFEAYGGTASLDFDTHLVWIYDALKEKDVKSIIYINGPGALQSFTLPGVLPEVAELLKRIEVEYPSAAVYADKYYNYLIHSEGYQHSLGKPNVALSVGVVPNATPVAVTPVQPTSLYNSLELRVAHWRDRLGARLAENDPRRDREGRDDLQRFEAMRRPAATIDVAGDLLDRFRRPGCLADLAADGW
jgi:hypothetical protein